MKKFFLALSFLWMTLGCMAANDALAYGVRTYTSENEGAGHALVCFPIDNPADITEVYDLPGMYIRAAAGHDGIYYMIQSDDYMVAYSLWTLDISTGDLSQKISFPMDHKASALVFMDMTWSQTDECLYAWAWDIMGAGDTTGDEVDIPFGLFRLSPETGDVTLVGYEEYAAFVGIACNSDGDLFGLDSEGNLWSINKKDGQPISVLESTHMNASMLQSIDFDPEDGAIYWSGYESDGESGEGFFSKFTDNGGYWTFNYISEMPHNEEILGLYIDIEPVAAEAPQRPENCYVTPGAQGADEATIYWTTPSDRVDGQPLTSPIDMLILRDNQQVGEVKNLQPGSEGSFTDTNVPTGLHTYTLIPVNEAGRGRGAIMKNVYVGIDTPGAVTNLKAKKVSEDSFSIEVSWDAPTAGAHGGWFDTEGMTYSITRNPGNSELAKDYTSLSFTDDNISRLEGYKYVVTAVSKQGAGEAAVSNCVVSGPAMSLPLECDFSTENQRDLWTSIPNSLGDNWEPYYYSGIDLWCMRYYPEELDPNQKYSSWLLSPPLEIKKENHYTISYEMRAYGILSPLDFTVAYGDRMEGAAMTNVLKSVTDMTEADLAFIPFEHQFTAETDGPAYFGFGVGNLSPVWLANIKIKELSGKDLEVANFFSSPVANATYPDSFTVVVKNVGYEEVSSATVELIDSNDVILASATLEKSLQPLESAVVTLTWTPLSEGEYTLYARIHGDENSSNNLSQPLNVKVMPSGVWKAASDGNAQSATAPFYITEKNSYEETIYLAEDMNLEPTDIMGMAFDYWVYDNVEIIPFNVKIYLANTDLDGVTENNCLSPEEMTLVYEGPVTVNPYLTLLPLVFDTPFEYTGGNLMMLAIQENEGGGSIDLRWMGTYSSSFTDKTIYYRGANPFSGTFTGTLPEIPNLRFMIPAESGVESIFTENGEEIRYNLHGVRNNSPEKGDLIITRNGKRIIR